MGVISIKRFENRSRSTITLLNMENPGARGQGIPVPPGSHIVADMAIPWAPVQSDFSAHHLKIRVGATNRYSIWQAANADGDFIRFSTDGQWHDRGERVHGFPAVSTNLAEEFGVSFSLPEPFASLALNNRSIVVVDSHFEVVPIGLDLALAVTVLKRLENRSSSSVKILNFENRDTKGHDVSVPAGQSIELDMAVPWAGVQGDFAGHHLELQINNQTRFWIWQADNRNDGDYVRFSTNGLWSALATRVKGIAETGQSPADSVFTGDRSLIVTDNGFELWPHPALLDDWLGLAKSLSRPARLIKETPNPVPTSAPKRSAVAFNFAGPASDAFNRGQRGARFLYKDSGKRWEFTIGFDGIVVAMPPEGPGRRLDRVWSYKRVRRGEFAPLPQMDLIAANGSRVFAKAKDADEFYFATMDHLFVHAPKHAGPDAPEITIPSTYFKLDPEFNQPGARAADLHITTEGVPADHPSSERFPVFRRVFSHELLDMMIARMEPGVWQQMDFRPPQNVIGLGLRDLKALVAQLWFAVAGSMASVGPMALFQTQFLEAVKEQLRKEVETSSEPPLGIPTYRPVTYQRDDGVVLEPPAIKYDRVLDIGVGHVHLHQQYQRIVGGEIQPMLHAKTSTIMYRWLNGPVQDGDGYIDGTCCFYALVKHEPGSASPFFSLLFQDEQLYFTQRWRMVDPLDNKGVSFALFTRLTEPEFNWNPDTYWCPFRNRHITDQSRLAVSAQVLLVTGKVPHLDMRDGWRIYSINFSWGTMDRTWRWRNLPPGAVSFFTDTGDETISATDMESVYPQSIRLRDDMTIHLKGTHKVNNERTVGRWYQRYLPANNNLVPPASQLVAGQIPSSGYNHHWKFLPERVFRLADNFYCFGVYDQVDSRAQYYDVTPSTPTDIANLVAGGPGPWIDDRNQLYVSQWKFRWPEPHRPGADPIDPPSLFNPDTRLRIVQRSGRWIAMLWDKRDEDLLPFERRPMRVTLKNGALTVEVTIGTHHPVLQPPAVLNAYFWLEPNGIAGVAFESALTSPDVLQENVARVRIASLEGDPNEPTRVSRVVSHFDKATEGQFSVAGSRIFEHRWTPTPEEQSTLRRQCSVSGEMQAGTSIWFEDILGNVAPPERIFWQRSHSVQGVATPSMVPLGVPTTLTVRATDVRTGAVLTGTVKVNGEMVGPTDVPFTHTFIAIPEREFDPDLGRIIIVGIVNPVITVEVPDYSETEVPVTFFTPELQVRTEPVSFPIGPSVQVIVRAEDATTRAPVNGRVRLATVDVAATNTPFMFAFGPTVTSGVVTATGYPNKTFPIALFTPEMQTSVSPSPLPTGRPVDVTVRTVDTRTGQPVNGRVKLGGVDTAATNTPFVFTFGLRPPAGIVSAPFYSDAAIIWAPMSVSTMRTSITPFPIVIGRLIQVTVSAINEQTGAPVAGRVKVDGVDVAPTNTPFPFTFRMRRTGVFPEVEIVFPVVVVSAFGYHDTIVDTGVS